MVKCFGLGRRGQLAVNKETPLPIPAVPTPTNVVLRRPKQVRFCTGMSANLVQVICPIYLLFLTTKFDYSVFWPNYQQKCMIFL